MLLDDEPYLDTCRRIEVLQKTPTVLRTIFGAHFSDVERYRAGVISNNVLFT